MVNRLKLSIILLPIAFILVIGAYVYSLWSEDRKKTQDMPQEAVMMLVRDLLRFHEKRGGFPEDLGKLEKVVWEQKKKKRSFSVKNRALSHRNYYYFYTRISLHQFTLWAIPTGKLREETPTWFVVVNPNLCKRWKGPALPFEQIDRIEPNPSIGKLGVLGLIDQPKVDLKASKN